MITHYPIKTVVLHITTCCSHECPFCYFVNDSILRTHQKHSVLEKIIVEIAAAGAKEILFVGGDPASHPDVVELGVYAKSLGIKTAILSNTLHFQGNSKEQVAFAFDTIETTIHAPYPDIHNLICNKDGAFELAISNLKSFQDYKVSLGVVYNLAPNTYAALSETINRVIELDKVGIDHVILQRLAPVGRAYKKSNWHLPINAIDSVFEQVESSIEKFEIDIIFEDTFPLCVTPERFRHYISPCSWGYDSCSLDMHGNVSRCCTDPRYELGNILETPLLKLWNTNPFLHDKRCAKLVPYKCRTCKQYEHCRGGCVLASEMNGCQGDPLLFNNREETTSYANL